MEHKVPPLSVTIMEHNVPQCIVTIKEHNVSHYIVTIKDHNVPLQLEFPVKPRGQLQRENDLKFIQMMKEQRRDRDGKAVSDHGLYEMLQEYMIENETLR